MAKVTITAYTQETHVGIYDADGEQEGGAFTLTPDGLLRLTIVKSDGVGGVADARNYIVNLDRSTITEV